MIASGAFVIYALDVTAGLMDTLKTRNAALSLVSALPIIVMFLLRARVVPAALTHG